MLRDGGERQGSVRRCVGPLAACVVVLAASASLALATSAAAATAFVNFEEPPVEHPPFGPSISEQYLSEGVKFTTSTLPVAEPVGFSPFINALPVLYRDPALVPAGRGREDEDGQMLYAYYCSGEACSFNEYSAEIFGRLATETSRLKLSAATEKGGTAVLAGYNLEGELVAEDRAAIKTQLEAELGISTKHPEIAYFSLARLPGGEGLPALEMGMLEFEIPASPPPPAVVLEANDNNVSGSRGTTTTLTVHAERINQAKEPIELEISGLPTGVKLVGGHTIATGSDSTQLTFEIAGDAPLVNEARFTIAAKSPGVSEITPVTGTLTIVAPLSLELLETGSSAQSVELTPCGARTSEVELAVGPGVKGDTHLELSASGYTEGLSDSLSSSTLSLEGGKVVTLHLSESATSGTGEADVKITASSETLEPAVAVVHVKRTAGYISSVTPMQLGPDYYLPLTPQSDSPGSEVRIEGAGLCPGSTVTFGNQEARSTPSSYGEAGGSLIATIPGDAVPGIVTVTAPSGRLRSREPLAIDTFRNTWGWQFPNFVVKPSQLNDNVEVDLFGYENVYFSTPFGNIKSIEAAIWQAKASHLIGGGDCFGLTALIQWLSTQTPVFNLDESLLGYPHASTGPLAPHQLTGAAEPSAQLLEMLSVFHFDQESGQFLEYEQHEVDESTPISPTRTVDAVRAALAADDFYALPTVDVMNQGAEGGGHSLVPYDVEDAAGGGWYIDVYDPNRPATPESEESEPAGEKETGVVHSRVLGESRIYIAPNGEWDFNVSSTVNPETLAPREIWHGDAHHIFPATWGTIPNPFGPSSERPEFGSFKALAARASRAARASARSGMGGPRSLLALSTSTSAAKLTQISDADGHTLLAATGQENDTATGIPHAVLVYPATGATGTTPTALLPAGGSYRITQGGGGASSYTDSLLGGGMEATLSSRTSPNGADEIGVNADTGQISFADGSASKPLTIDMVSPEGHGRTRSLSLTGTARRGGKLTLAFKGAGVSLLNTGPVTTVTLALSAVSSAGLPVAFQGAPLQIGAGQRASFTPSSWQTLSTLSARIGRAGSARTLTLANRLRLAAPAIAVHARKSGPDTQRLTITARLPDVGAGAELELQFKVLRGGRVVLNHLATLSAAQLHGGAGTASVAFTAPQRGHYTFTAQATVISSPSTVIELGASRARTMSLQLG